jgi:gamma-glutamyltranspeptidase/glutathione hydrolase
MAPAIRLARDGFVVDSTFARSVTRDRRLITAFAGAAVFLPGGAPPPVGTTFKQTDLARTLDLIATEGAAAFYHGSIARAIANEMQADSGLITAKDLAQYRAIRRDVLRSTYRGDTLLTMPPASSGGITLIESLNVVETFAQLPPFGSAGYEHILADAFQRAFMDRNGKLGDPAFVTVPMAHLTDKGYAREIRTSMSSGRATPTSQLAADLHEGSQTTHYSVVDSAGNAVATTTTLNGLYGSGVYVRGAGFFLNNEMDDFATRPGVPNQFGLVEGPQNAIAPGKRMLSAMSPTIVLDSAGTVLLVVGGRGGPRIITSTAQVILNVIDRHMDLVDALSAPRIHHQAIPDSLRYDQGGLILPVRDSLAAMGYALAVGGASGTCTAVMRVAGGGLAGAVDPRSTGGAAGY